MLILRTYAIFDNDKRVGLVLSVLLVGLAATGGYFVVISQNPVSTYMQSLTLQWTNVTF
jgi:hypothetical protein